LTEDASRLAVSAVERQADGEAAPNELASLRQTMLQIGRQSSQYPPGVRQAVGAVESLIRVWPTLPSFKHYDAYYVSRSAAEAAAKLGPWEEERQAQLELLRDIFGNPFRLVSLNPAWLSWRDGLVRKITETIYAERSFEELPILADALEDAGCDNADILTHCRQPGDHVRGCWVIDLLLGKS
jgi:hypothetical protein